jgi:hypothetical protein
MLPSAGPDAHPRRALEAAGDENVEPGSRSAAILVHGREDTGGELGRAAAVDELEDGMEIDPAGLGDRSGRLAQPRGADGCADRRARIAADRQVIDADPAAMLIDATAGLDLLVLGSRDGGRIDSLLRRSVARELVRPTVCPTRSPAAACDRAWRQV